MTAESCATSAVEMRGGTIFFLRGEMMRVELSDPDRLEFGSPAVLFESVATHAEA